MDAVEVSDDRGRAMAATCGRPSQSAASWVMTASNKEDPMTKRISALVVVAALATPLLAGCGSGYNSPTTSASRGATTTRQTAATTVKTASAGGLGTILVDGQ